MRCPFIVACAFTLLVIFNTAYSQVKLLKQPVKRPAEQPEVASPAKPVVERPEIEFKEPAIPKEKEIDETKISDETKNETPIETPVTEEYSYFQKYLMKRMPLTISRSVSHFGYNFFRQPPATFTPVETIPVTAGYVIGPGDEIRINVWGMLEGRWNLLVDRDGNIDIPTVGTVSVAGLTYKNLENFLKKEISKHYKEFQINVSMGRLRTIPVYLVGNVKKPGNYTVSSLSTLVNALFASGGPTTSGTMRNIQLKRQGKTIVEFDMYDFLLKGDKTKDVRLQPEDVIFVPPAGHMVAIIGQVTTPAIYELKGDTTLTGLIDMAGGVTATGYTKKVQVERIFQNERKVILDKNLKELSDEDDIKLANGDIVAIYPISDIIINAVTLTGNVVRPGQYQWRDGMRVSDIIENEQAFLLETDLEYALIERLKPPSLEREIIFFNPGKAILEKDPNEDKLLQPYDTIRIFSLWESKERPVVQIAGAVNKPGTYNYWEKMRVSDLVKIAGGLKYYAYMQEAELTRVFPKPDGTETQRISVNLEKVMLGDPAHDIVLNRNDYLFVRPVPDWKAYGTVQIKDEKLTRVFPNLEGTETQRISVSHEKALQDDSEHNLLLNHDDYLFIRPVPDKHLLYETVTITGEVKFPGRYTIKKGETITSLIARAGGFTDEAYIRGAVFTREDVRKSQREQIDKMIDRIEMELLAPPEIRSAESTEADVKFHKAEIERKRELIKKLRAIKPDGRVVISLTEAPVKKIYDIQLRDGDTIVIPKNPGIITVLGAVYNPTSFVYDGRSNYNRYIQMAGGFTHTADRRKVYVIKVDGTIVKPGTRYALEPGDAIVVPEKIEIISVRREIRDIVDILYKMAITVAATATIF